MNGKAQREHARNSVALSPVHNSNNVKATGNIVEATFDFVEATFDFVATNGNSVDEFIVKFRPFHKVECCFDIVAVFRTMSHDISSVQFVSTLSKERNFVRHCCRNGQHCWRNVAETGNIVAKNGNNVETAFDVVERIVPLVAFENVASTFLLVWTRLLQSCLLLRHCCWYGRGFRL